MKIIHSSFSKFLVGTFIALGVFSSVVEAQGTIKRCSTDRTCSVNGTLRQCIDNGSCSVKFCNGSVCIPGGKGILCSRDSDCDQKRCYSDGVCDFGGQGRPCSEGLPCPAKTCIGPVCANYSSGSASCTNNSDCEPIKTCDGDVCITDGPIFSRRCTYNQDCDFYKTCASGTCTTSDSSPFPGRICISDQDCDRPACVSGTCTQHNGGSASCTSDSDCRYGMCPPSALCVTMPLPGISECTPGGSCSPTRAGAFPESVRHTDEEQRIEEKARELFKDLDTNLASTVIRSVGVETLGNSSAPVTVAMFQDLKCGMCKRAFRQVFPMIKKRFIDYQTVRFAFLDFPLTRRDGEYELALGARCANNQGMYLPFLAYLYGQMSISDPAHLIDYGQTVGLDVHKLKQCIDARTYENIIDSTISLGRQLEIEGTPTFIINDRVLIGAQREEVFSTIIEDELSLLGINFVGGQEGGAGSGQE